MNIKELNEFMRDHGFCNTNNEDDLPKKYVCDLVESALKEGRNKAIDEFAERLKLESYNGYATLEDYSEDTIESVALEDVYKIAEQLKAGVKNDN